MMNENDDPQKSTSFLASPEHILQITSRLLMMSQLPGNLYASMWEVITHSLDNDFIHGDIHTWSCKKRFFITVTVIKI